MYCTIALQPCLLSISLSIVALRYSSSHPRYAAAFSPPLQRIHSTFPCTHDNALERSNTNDNRPMCSSGIRIDGIDIDGVCHVGTRPVRQLQSTRLSLSTSTVTAVDEGGGDNVEVGSVSMKTTDDYGAGQITVLEGLDPVRKRPGMCVSFHRMQYVLYGCVYIHIGR